jgi:hypothetical protein
MSEAEIVQALLNSIQVVVSLFSMFFAMISAYIAGLYFFLNRAPVSLKLLAFFLLSIGLVFLGVSAAIQQKVQAGLHAALSKLPAPVVGVEALRNPLPLPMPPGWALYEMGVAIGWITALSVYLALGYMTFVHRWDQHAAVGRGNGS